MNWCCEVCCSSAGSYRRWCWVCVGCEAQPRTASVTSVPILWRTNSDRVLAQEQPTHVANIATFQTPHFRDTWPLGVGRLAPGQQWIDDSTGEHAWRWHVPVHGHQRSWSRHQHHLAWRALHRRVILLLVITTWQLSNCAASKKIDYSYFCMTHRGWLGCLALARWAGWSGVQVGGQESEGQSHKGEEREGGSGTEEEV